MSANPELIKKIGHPKVTEGKWASEYHKPTPSFATDWRLASELPTQYEIRNGTFEPKYLDYVEMIDDMFSLLVDFKLEAWRERISNSLSSKLTNMRMFDLIYESKGSSPQEVPVWGPAKINLPKVFRINSLTKDEILPGFKYGMDPADRDSNKDKHHTHVWIAKPSVAPLPEGMSSELKELVSIFGYPFYFFKPGEWDNPIKTGRFKKDVQTDPYRMHLKVGVGRYIPPHERGLVMAAMLTDGTLDEQSLNRMLKAANRLKAN